MSQFLAMMPFSVFRHIHPRASGRIVFGGGGASLDEIRGYVQPEIDAAVADRLNKYTGLSDSMKSGFDAAKKQFGDIGTQLSTSFADAQTRMTDANSGLMNAMELNQKGVLEGQSNLQQNLGTQIGTGFTDVGGQLTNVGNSLGTLGENLNTGFADAGARFSGLEDSAANMQSSMDSGFQETGNALSDIGTQMSDNNTETNKNITDSFSAQNDALGQGFADAAQQVDDLQANVLGGQDTLGESINTVGSSLDTYYGDLAANQAAMADANSDFKTSFDDYVGRYADDTTLANQDRADMARAIKTEAADSRDLMKKFAAAGQQERYDLGKALAGANSGIQDTQQAIADNSGLMVQQVGEVGNLVQDQGQNTINALSNVRNILSGDISGISGEQVQQFRQINNAFNREGQLIENQITANGTILTNKLDEAGNLTTSEYATNGNLLGSSSVNMNNFAG